MEKRFYIVCSMEFFLYKVDSSCMIVLCSDVGK